MNDSKATLEKLLPIAVFMWVDKLKDEPIDSLLPRLEGYSSFIGSHGDVLMYGGGKKGVAADCFNKVAEGLAVLSMVCTGGVDFGDLHFEYPHKELKREV